LVANCAKLCGRIGWGPNEADQRVAIPGGRTRCWGLKEEGSKGDVSLTKGSMSVKNPKDLRAE
jgi:hypothetical protein